MKTLDEVIKALEMCTADNCVCLSGCPYSYLADGDDGCEYHAIPAMQTDALHYLKEYQGEFILEARNGLAEKFVDAFVEAEENHPLTWDELKQMEGKPVWVEALLYKQWAVIAYIGEEHIRFEGANLYAPESRIYMGEDNGWQAYRKEREC